MTSPIRHVLLDIEGTTAPVRFVSETLFPYAAERMAGFLEARGEDGDVRELLAQVAQAWRDDPNAAARELLHLAPRDASPASRVLPYLRWLIQEDRKLTPLKDLQGLVWEEGYASGALQGPLYPDVAPALRRWREAGLGLAVYSSGSVRAQQLIYGHSNAGDLRGLFQHWFDTRIGSKQESTSYRQIVTHLEAPACSVLFISDSIPELMAAAASGLAVLLCDRGDSQAKPMDSEGFTVIHSFENLDLGACCA
jgi:enolase-phosphatase E1